MNDDGNGPGTGARRPKASGAIGLWIFAALWWGVLLSAFSNRPLTSSDPVYLIVQLAFAGAGLAMLWQAAKATLQHWRHQDWTLHTRPAVARGGEPLQAELHLPSGTLRQGMRLRLGQYRTDETVSSPTPRLCWEQDQPALLQPAADGSCRVSVGFVLPADAPSSGARIGGEDVTWLIELIDAKGSPQLEFELGVAAGDGAVAAPVEPGDRKARFDISHAVPEVDPEDRLAPLHPSLVVHADRHGWELRVQRRWARRAAWVVAAVLVGVALHLLGLLVKPGPLPLRLLLNVHAVLALALVVLLHLGSLRWHLRIDADGVSIDRSSWIWPRRVLLPAAVVDTLSHRLLYTVSGGNRSRATEHHAVYGRVGLATEHKLLPALPGAAAAQAAVQHLRRARDDHRARFTPGRQRGQAAAAGAWPRGVHIAAWGGWALVVVGGWLALTLV